MKIYHLVAMVTLVSCATAYGPVDTIGGFETGGYVDTRINANTVVVSFNGNMATPCKTVRAYLLYRAASLTMEYGFDYFIITSSTNSPVNVNVKTQNVQHTTIPARAWDSNFYTDVTYQSYNKSRSRAFAYDPNRCAQQNLHSASIVIKMFQGPIPSGLPNAFDVDDVMAHLGPTTF